MIRITPAYAGNTVTSGKLNHPIRDHPRIRGEHSYDELKEIWKCGSPPHTRGTRPNVLANVSFTGITPAYAGNTEQIELIAFVVRDHPRIRGEHNKYSIF